MSSLLIVLLFVCCKCCVGETTLAVAAASDLTALEPELKAAFHQVHPEIGLQFSSGASAMLAQQIENGAPFDVFLSANSAFVDQLAASGKLAVDSVRRYAEGRVGLLWRDRKTHPFRDLAEDRVHFVALPNPKLAPYGVAAQQALEHEGMWEAVRPKVVYGENVRQALQLLESGNADAVLTSNSLLQGKGAQLIPAEWHRPIVQKAGVVAGSREAGAARTFLEFLTSAAGQAVFARFGFSSPSYK